MQMLVLASVLFCSSYVQAAPLPTSPGDLLVKLVPQADNLLLLRLSNLQQANTTVTLMNLDGETYFNRQIHKHNGYLLKINLENAPEGRYVLRVSQKGEVATRVIYKGSDQVLVSYNND